MSQPDCPHRWGPWTGATRFAYRERVCLDCGYIQTQVWQRSRSGRL